MKTSWLDLEKGDIFHSLIFNPATFCYEYQEVKVKKIANFTSFTEILFKYTDLNTSKRIRFKLYISNSCEKLNAVSEEGKEPIYCKNIFAIEKEELGEALNKVLDDFIKKFEYQIVNNIKFLNYIKKYVKNQNPLQS